MDIRPTSPPTDKSLDTLIPDLASQYKVPGAAAGLLVGDRKAIAVAGITNTRTQTPVTLDTVFQIGSITKVLTSVLVLQLVDDGLLDLDAPLRKYLPQLQLGDRRAADVVTMRQLLCHTCGLQGDYYADFGWGPDTVQRYVESLNGVDQVHPPGERFSYSNPGYVLAGRVIEVIRGATWNDALAARVLAPASLAHSGTRPEEALLHSAAIGHVPAPDGALHPAPVWAMFPSQAPAGATAFCSAGDLLGIGAILLGSGKAMNGAFLVSPKSCDVMLAPQVAVPTHAYAEAQWGVGVSIEKWGGTTVVGHDGGTPTGQVAALRLVPDRQVVACVMANSLTSAQFVLEALDEMLAEHAKVTRPEVPAPLPPGDRPDAAQFVGVYRRLGSELEVTAGPNHTLQLVERAADGMRTHILEPVSARTYRYTNLFGIPDLAVFDGADEGPPDYLLLSRAHRRVSQP